MGGRVIVKRPPAGGSRADCEDRVSTLLIIVLILLLLGVAPRWRYSSSWGYGPSGIVGLVLIIIIVLALLGRL